MLICLFLPYFSQNIQDLWFNSKEDRKFSTRFTYPFFKFDFCRLQGSHLCIAGVLPRIPTPSVDNLI